MLYTGEQLRASTMRLNLTNVLKILFAILSSFACLTAGRCKFPKDWKGRWYQSGLGDIIISSSRISNKGVCEEHRRDYYLLEDPLADCFRCLLLMKRHRNIIEYKETFCMQANKLQSICNHIKAEDILHTMVREPTTAVRCPFVEAYHFTYNEGHNSPCNAQTSYLKPCVDKRHLEWQFRHCDNAASMHNTDLKLECLATWKEGSNLFLYGRFSGPSISRKDSSYRCFAYEVFGPDVYVAMSVDATCRGLGSSRHGPIVMEMSRDSYGWPQASCKFPEWLANRGEWRDIEGKYTYNVDDKREILTITDIRQTRGSVYPVIRQVKCIDALWQDGKEKEYVFVGFGTYGCESEYQCLRLVKLHHGALRLYYGRLINSDDTNACLAVNREDRTSTLIADTGNNIQGCPFPGIYVIDTPTEDCDITVDNGCANHSRFDIQRTCAQKDGNSVRSIECLSWWKEENQTYVLVREQPEDQYPAGCVSLSWLGDLLQLRVAETCGVAGTKLLDSELDFGISLQKDCNEDDVLGPADKAEVTNNNPVIVQNGFQPSRTDTEEKSNYFHHKEKLRDTNSTAPSPSSCVFLRCELSIVLLFVLLSMSC